MASITIRNNVGDDLKQRLRLRTTQHGRSMEEEARVILRTALAGPPQAEGENLFERIHRRFAAVGGVELDLPPREPVRDPPTFD